MWLFLAKSLKNFVTIREFTKQHSPRLLRFLILKTLYRSPVDYNESIILQAEREVQRLDEFTGRLQTSKLKDQKSSILNLNRTKQEFRKAMEDDFNTPKAMAAIFELINKGNSLIDEGKLTKKTPETLPAF